MVNKATKAQKTFNRMSKAKQTIVKHKEVYLKGIRFSNLSFNTNESTESFRKNYDAINWGDKT